MMSPASRSVKRLRNLYSSVFHRMRQNEARLADPLAGRTCFCGTEQLEPRLLLSGAPYLGAESVHLVDTATWWVGNAGSAYGPDGADGWIDAEDGIIRHNSIARSDLIGAAGATVTDKITKEFTVSSSGQYAITMDSTLVGGIWSAGDTVIIGGNGGTFEIWLTSRLSGGTLYPQANVEALYESDIDPVSLLIDMGQQAMDNVVDFYEAVGSSGASLPAQYVEAAVGTIKDLIPDESWPPKPVSHSLEMSAYLEAGTTYTWEFGMVSTTIAACIALGSETCMTDFTIELDDVDISLTSGTNHRPVLDNPTVTPQSGDASDTYVFTVHYSDEDGDPPLYGQTQLYLSGSVTPHQMTRVSGSAADGVYSTGPLSLASGSYQHSFTATDSGDLDQWLGWLPGPYVGIADGSDLARSNGRWDDGTASGDDDGVVEAGEAVKTQVLIRSAQGASNVDAWLSTTEPDIRITQPYVYYEDFAPGQQQWPVGWFRMDLDFALSPGQTRSCHFTLSTTYELDGVQYAQEIPFTKTLYRDGDISASFAVTGFTIDDSTGISYRNNGDGIFQSGERIHILPTIRNSGTSSASDINVELFYAGSGGPVDVRGGYEQYPDLSTGQSSPPSSGEFFTLDSTDWSFAGDLPVSMRVFWDENGAVPVEFVNAFTVPVVAAPIIRVDDSTWSFGVVSPGTPVTHEVEVTNLGSGTLHVTSITSSHADTVATPQTFTVPPGGSVPVLITLDTSSVPAGTTVTRTVTLNSDGRLAGDAPPSNTVEISGEVRDDAGILYRIPAQPASYNATDIGGTHIVWEDHRTGAGDIYLFDLATGLERNLTAGQASSQEAPRISGDLVAWTDSRNGNADIYGYDLGTDTEYAIANTSAGEILIGVDGDLVAFARADFTYDSYGATLSGYNVYLYRISSQATTKISNYSAVAGTFLWSAEIASEACDFADGVIVWRAGMHALVGGGDGWNSGYTSHVTKYAVGVDVAPVNLEEGFETGPTAGDGRIVWTENISGDYQIFLWSGGPPQKLTSDDHGSGNDALAMGGGIVVYDYWTSPGLYYWDISKDQRHILVDSPANCESVRIDDNGIVWLASDPGPTIFCLLRNQTDLAILPGDISFSDSAPSEGDAIDVSVTVRNTTSLAVTEDVTVRLYSGDPDAGGFQIGNDVVVIGGLAGHEQRPVSFIGVAVPDGPGGTDPSGVVIYARLSVNGFDPGHNNAASATLEVFDDDTDGPAISGVLVAESNGDGDGVVGTDEEIQVSWSLSDASGIASTELLVDGSPVTPVSGLSGGNPANANCFAVLGPLAAGEHAYEIRTTDGDNSPADSVRTGTFEVVDAEEITVLFDASALTDGQSGVTDFGTVARGASSIQRIFVVRNDGQQVLSLGAILVPGGFTVTGPAASVVQPGGTTHFTVTLATGALGTFAGEVTLANSDGDEDPFNFPIEGYVSNLPGDTNGDGRVDAADYITLKRNFGRTSGAAREDGDLDGDGDVDWHDLQTLTTNFGASLGATPASVQAGVTESTESVMETASEPKVDAVAEPLTALVADVPDADVLAIAATVFSNSAVAGGQVVPPTASPPVNLLPPVHVPAPVSRAPMATSHLLSADRAGQVAADVLQLAAPWWPGDSVRHELPDEQWMTRLTADIVGRPRKSLLVLRPGNTEK